MTLSGDVDLGEILSVALDLSRQAGALTLTRFGRIISADTKEDGTPVTVMDREAESLLRDGIRERFPGHGVLGEEFGEDVGTDPVRWILDPIDGTRSFMRGVPLYAVLIGVEVQGDPVVGVVHLPALGETVAAASGLGSRWIRDGWRVEERARVSEVSELSEAMLLTTSFRSTASSPLIGNGWSGLVRRVGQVRGWGDAYGHAVVATGRADIMVDPVLSLWDAAPLLPILQEAGGRFTDLEGNATASGGSGVSTNGRLHASTLEILTEKR